MKKIKIVISSKPDLKILEDLINSEIRKKIIGKDCKTISLKNNKKKIYSIISDNQRIGYFYKKKKKIFLFRRYKNKLRLKHEDLYYNLKK